MTSLKTLELGRSKVVFRAQLDDFSQCLGLFTSMRQMYLLNIHQHLFCSLAGLSVAINGLTCTHDLWRKCLATFIFMLLFFLGPVPCTPTVILVLTWCTRWRRDRGAGPRRRRWCAYNCESWHVLPGPALSCSGTSVILIIIVAKLCRNSASLVLRNSAYECSTCESGWAWVYIQREPLVFCKTTGIPISSFTPLRRVPLGKYVGAEQFCEFRIDHY